MNSGRCAVPRIRPSGKSPPRCSKAPCSAPRAVTSMTRPCRPTTSCAPPRAKGATSCSTPRWSKSAPPKARSRASPWPTAPRSTPPWWSTAPAPTPSRSTRWPGRLGRLQHQNQSPAPRGHVLPLARRLRLPQRRLPSERWRHRLLHPPGSGQPVLIGSEDPECDPQEWVDPDEFYAGKGGHGRDNQLTEEQWKAQCYRLARRIPTLKVPNQPKGVATCTTAPTTGFRSTTNPTWAVSTWPSAPAATSTRTLRWWAHDGRTDRCL
jgi:hypothetical protein